MPELDYRDLCSVCDPNSFDCAESHTRLKIAPVDPEGLLERILSSGVRTIVVPSNCFARSRELVALLDQRNLSVFLVK